MLYHTKVKLKWIKELNVRVKTKNSQKKTRVNLHDLEFSNDFLDTTPKAKATKNGSS